jgi:uncharacterized protein YjbI with pentapeptide repeats
MTGAAASLARRLTSGTYLVFAWVRDNNAFVNACATTLSTIVAAMAVWLSLAALNTQRTALTTQREQNAILQIQIDEQRAQYESSRASDLAKAVFDPTSNKTLRSFALRELFVIHNAQLNRLGLLKRIVDSERDLEAQNNSEVTEAWKQIGGEINENMDEKKRIEMALRLSRIALRECQIPSDNDSAPPSFKILDLREANLVEVDLSNISVYCVNFTKANLTGATVGNSHISHALFNGAFLHSAKFVQSTISWTIFDPSDLQSDDEPFGWTFGKFTLIPCNRQKLRFVPNSGRETLIALRRECTKAP